MEVRTHLPGGKQVNNQILLKMPVEIRELQITTVVQDAGQKPAAAASQSSTANNDAVISACVEQVLEILKQKTER
jgi:hypothetical protein